MSAGRRMALTRFPWLVVLASTALAQERPLPEVDFEAMEPPVASKIRRHVDAVSTYPSSPEGWGSLGVVLQAHGLDREAAECYQHAVVLDATDFRWRYLLVHASRSTDLNTALEASAAALDVNASYPPLHVLRGELLEESGDNDGALEHYREAFALDPTSANAAFGAGRLLLAAGELESARELLESAVALDDNAGAIHGALAQLYRRLGDRPRATEEARLARERTAAVAIADPLHFEMRQESVSSIAQLDRAQRATEASDHLRALQIYEALVELRPEDADMRARLGDTLAALRRADDATAQYRAGIAINDAHAWSLYGLGNIMNAAQRYDEAEAYYRRALAVDDGHAPTLVNLGSLLGFRGNVAEAERMFRRGLEADPEHFGCHRQLGDLLLRTERSREAIPHLRAAVAARPEFGPVHRSLAIALGRQGEFEEAWTHVERAETYGAPVPAGFVEALKRSRR